MNVIGEMKEKQRILEIEGLRAVAVIAVILNHFFESFFRSGFLGVDVFFVVSGFVITKSLVESSYSSWRSFLQQFFARRKAFPDLMVLRGIDFRSFLVSYDSPLFGCL